MKFVTSNCSIGYPVYGAKFLNNRMLLVAGGGGEGSNGIPNKLTVLRIDFAKKRIIKRFREITLDPNDDSPTTLDVANNTILLGCNENSEKIKKGEGNYHLRKFLFENEHLKFVASIDFDRSKEPDDYTKLIYLSRDGSVGAIASSAIPTVIRIIDPKELTEKYEIETGHEVKDMHFAPNGKVISYITASTLEVISIVTGRFIIRKTDFEENYSLSKIKFLTDDVILIAASLKKGLGIVLIKISLRSGNVTVLKSRFLTNRFKGVTAMDVDYKNELAVLAGSDNSLVLVKLKDLSIGRMFKQVHSFAITRVSFSPDSSLIASVSAANTVHVIKVPENFANSTSIWSKLWKLLLNFVLVALVAFLAQMSLKYDLYNKSSKLFKEWYEERKNRSIVKREDSEQVTLVGGVSNDIAPSVVSTYSASSDTVSSEIEPTKSISSGLRNPETTSLVDASLSSSLIDLTTTPLSSSLGHVSEIATSSSIPSDDIVSKNGIPEIPNSTSITVTDTSRGISEQTRMSLVTHHGPTPKSNVSSSAATAVDSEISSKKLEPEPSKTTRAKYPETSLSLTSSVVAANSHSVESQKKHFSSLTSATSILTESTVSLSTATASDSKSTLSYTETLGESDSRKANVPVYESTLTAHTHPNLGAHNGNETASVVATTKIDNVSESKLNASSESLSPSNRSLQKTGVTEVSIDDTTTKTAKSAKSSSVSSTAANDKPLSHVSAISKKGASATEIQQDVSALSTVSSSESDTVTSPSANIPVISRISRSEGPTSSTGIKDVKSTTTGLEISPFNETPATGALTQKETTSASISGGRSVASKPSSLANSDVVSLSSSIIINSEQTVPASSVQFQTGSVPLNLHSEPSKKTVSVTGTTSSISSSISWNQKSTGIDKDSKTLTSKTEEATRPI